MIHKHYIALTPYYCELQHCSEPQTHIVMTANGQIDGFYCRDHAHERHAELGIPESQKKNAMMDECRHCGDVLTEIESRYHHGYCHTHDPEYGNCAGHHWACVRPCVRCGNGIPDWRAGDLCNICDEV